MINKISKGINYINLISFCTLTASILFFFSSVMRISYYVFLISYVLEFILEKRWQNLKINNYRIFFLLLLALYLLGLFSYFFDDTPIYFEYIINRRLPLLAFSVVGFFGVNKLYSIKYFFNTMIVTAVLTALYLIVYRIGLMEFILRPDKTEMLWNNRIAYVNDHMMFNFYLNMALIGTWYIFSTNWKSLKLWLKISYAVSAIFIMYIVLLSEGRCGVIECLLIVSAIILFETWKRSRIATIGILSLSLIFFFMITSHHKRMSKEMMVSEPRLFLWQGALTAIKEKPVLGYGLSNAQERFDVERAKIEPLFFKEWAKQFYLLDCHNQYLQATLEFGAFGLLLLLSLYFYPIYCTRNSTRILAFFVIGLCMYQSIFDIFLTGQKANIFSMLVIMLFLENDRELSQKTLNPNE
jgi:O-antigen ligase